MKIPFFPSAKQAQSFLSQVHSATAPQSGGRAQSLMMGRNTVTSAQSGQAVVVVNHYHKTTQVLSNAAFLAASTATV